MHTLTRCFKHQIFLLSLSVILMLIYCYIHLHIRFLIVLIVGNSVDCKSYAASLGCVYHLLVYL